MAKLTMEVVHDVRTVEGGKDRRSWSQFTFYFNQNQFN